VTVSAKIGARAEAASEKHNAKMRNKSGGAGETMRILLLRQ
jgi:hypothetical protein